MKFLTVIVVIVLILNFVRMTRKEEEEAAAEERRVEEQRERARIRAQEERMEDYKRQQRQAVERQRTEARKMAVSLETSPLRQALLNDVLYDLSRYMQEIIKKKERLPRYDCDVVDVYLDTDRIIVRHRENTFDSKKEYSSYRYDKLTKGQVDGMIYSLAEGVKAQYSNRIPITLFWYRKGEALHWEGFSMDLSALHQRI